MSVLPIENFSVTDVLATIRAHGPDGDNTLESYLQVEPPVHHRAGSNIITYLNIKFRLGTDKPWKRPSIYFGPERQGGTIRPLLQADADKINQAKMSGASATRPTFQVKPRGDKIPPSFTVRKYNQTFDPRSREMSKIGDDTPSSELFVLIEFLHKFLVAERQKIIDSKTFVSQDTFNGFTQDEKAEYKAKNGGTIYIFKNTSVVSPIQTAVSMTVDSPDAGKELDNPILRLTLTFKEANAPGKKTETQFFDDSSYRVDDNGNYVCDPLKINGQPITAENVHLIPSGSLIRGKFRPWGVFSQQGFSTPVRLDCANITLPAPRSNEGNAIQSAWKAMGPPPSMPDTPKNVDPADAIADGLGGDFNDYTE